MAKIITKKAVQYDTRSPKFGKIMMEMATPVKQNDCFMITVTDYIVIEKINEDETISRSFVRADRETKNVSIPIDKINQLHAYIEGQLPADIPYTEKDEIINERAFLHYVQTDLNENDGNKCIYSLEPQDFELFKG